MLLAVVDFVCGNNWMEATTLALYTHSLTLEATTYGRQYAGARNRSIAANNQHGVVFVV